MSRTASEVCKAYNDQRKIRQGVYDLTQANMAQAINELFDLDSVKAREFCMALSVNQNLDPSDYFNVGRTRNGG